MWQIMVYTVVVSAALIVLGLGAEKLAVMLRRPRRHFWAVTMAISLLWPLAAVMWNDPAAVVAVPETAIAPPDAGSLTAPVLPRMPDAAPPGKTLDASPAGNAVQRIRMPSDRILIQAWAAFSVCILLYLIGGELLIRRRASRWKGRTILGQPVLVSESTGPALLGALRPKIIVPAWFLDEPATTQSLILEHEQQHISARDPLLLRVTLLLVAAAPWNLPLWWQLRRLRQAIELDCDARVLRSGAEAGVYGEVLLNVTQRADGLPFAAVAMSEPVSALERRIRCLAAGPERFSAPRALAVLGLWSLGAGVALSLEAPSLQQGATQALRSAESALRNQVEQSANTPARKNVAQAPPDRSNYVGTVITKGQTYDLVKTKDNMVRVMAASQPAPVRGSGIMPAASPGAGNIVDMRELIAAVGRKFQKRFVIDPRAQAKVDLSSLTADSLTYHAFLEILGVNGFVAVPAGDVVRIIPEDNARTAASPIYTADNIQGDDAEIVTVVIPISGIRFEHSPEDIAISMRMLVSPYGMATLMPDGKSLLVVEKVANAKRIVAVVRSLSKSQ
jgi:beta-lactamase regulating signal transducer with metallopeptidase domain